ncbi:hypothetical protein PF010_g30553, partial [Phytophthora fragariae]
MVSWKAFSLVVVVALAMNGVTGLEQGKPADHTPTVSSGKSPTPAPAPTPAPTTSTGGDSVAGSSAKDQTATPAPTTSSGDDYSDESTGSSDDGS